MSRGFCGTRGAGAGGSSKKGKSAKDIFLRKMRGESDANLTAEDRYQKVFDEKMAELEKRALARSKYGDEGKKLSKTAVTMLETLAQKQAKKAAKMAKRSYAVEIKQTRFVSKYGGGIDRAGRIFGPDGKIVAKITKDGTVKSMWGIKIGKYDGSQHSLWQISQYVDGIYEKQANGNIYGTKGHASSTPVGSFGGDSGNFWGNSSDNNGGGFWG